MKPPANVAVGPYRIDVVVDQAAIDRAGQESNGDKLYGHFDVGAGRIALSPGMSADSQAETLLHEVLHAVAATSGLDEALDDRDLEERIVRALSPTLLDVLRRNPALVKYLTHGA